MQIPLRNKPVEIELESFGISAFTSRHAPSFDMPFMSNDYHKICYVESGSGHLEESSDQPELAPATMVRIPPDLSHRFVDKPGAPMTLSILCVDSRAFSAPVALAELWRSVLSVLPDCTPRTIPFKSECTVIEKLYHNVVLELGQNLPDRAASTLASSISLAVTLTRSLGRELKRELSNAPDQFLESVIELDKRFTEEIHVGDLAKQAGMSYRSYTDHFRKYTGMTVTQYLTHQRIEFAERRILETEDIMGASLEAGYGDLGHFYRLFKRHTNETPQAFLDRKKKEAENAD
jgi:AraC-like DNA-binding protein